MHVNVNNFECIIAETIYLYYLHIDGESMTNATWCIELLIRSVVQTIPWNGECITCANTLAIQTEMCHTTNAELRTRNSQQWEQMAFLFI